MSEPKRYEPSPYKRLCISTDEDDEGNLYCPVEEDSEGEFVLWTDYARLKLEVERLTKMKQDLFDSNDQQVKHIERLTKAGDNLEQVLTEISYSYRAGNASHEWRAAKNGNPTK